MFCVHDLETPQRDLPSLRRRVHQDGIAWRKEWLGDDMGRTFAVVHDDPWKYGQLPDLNAEFSRQVGE